MKYSGGLKLWSTPWLAVAAGAAGLYASSFLIYTLLVRKQDLSKISPLMGTAVIALVVLGAVVFFGESLSLRRILGLALACGAILLLAG